MSATTETAPRQRGEALRDRAVDLALIALAAAVAVSTARRGLLDPTPVADWLRYADWAAGALGCVALGWRRRYPVALGLALAVASAFSETVQAAAVVSLFGVAVRAPTRVAIGVGALSFVAVGVYQRAWPEPGIAPLTVLLIVGLGHLATVAWGLYARSRRALVASLTERAAAAEREAQQRAEENEREARSALAREMHDVLGHRLSLLSVHAGALAYHPDAPAQDRARAAEVVRESAHLALQDLREVIGLLRAPAVDGVLPGIGDVGELLGEARRAGMSVELQDEAGVATGGRRLPEMPGRAVYRLVQEGLTNVRKHAPGTEVVVRITGEPGDHVTAEVVNARPEGPPSSAVGSGEGLRGLDERARLLAGRLDHGPTDSGGWRTRIRIPWPP